MQYIKYILYVLAVISFSNCKTPYTPAPTTTPTNYLVVEGMINLSDSTYITLSRTVTLSAKSAVKPELKATVTIESNTGGSYPLKELGNGVYIAAPLNLSAANQYRLRIKTSTGNTYASDFVNAMVSPAIDSITFKATSTNLNIYASTHDPKNATRYYRWDFNEAWEFHSFYDSQIISDGLQVSRRTSAQQIWDCFKGDASTNISLGTSIQLSADVISQALITTIASDAEKIGIKYTIGVRQYALTKDAYDYWTLLKKNTEKLGSVFDSQPSASIGNIHNVNIASEPVIGYISAGTISVSRIFITKRQLPNWLTTPAYGLIPTCGLTFLNCCASSGQPPTTDNYVNWLSSTFIQSVPFVPIATVDPNFSGSLTNNTPITAADPICVDCTLRGSKTPPAYWK